MPPEAADGDGDLWFLPSPLPEDDDPVLPPWPQADRRALIEPDEWLLAQADLAADLARAAMVVGHLDAVVAAMGSSAVTRLALRETEAMLWAQGMPLPPEDISRDMAGARADSDPAALAWARWAMRRLQGQGGLDDLRGFLGLHRVDAQGRDGAGLRACGTGFDAAAAGFAGLMSDLDRAGSVHPLTRGAFARRAWGVSDLSAMGDVVEAATYAARVMAADCQTLLFVPMGRYGRAVWSGFAGTGPEALAAHLRAVTEGAQGALLDLTRLREWADRAHAATARIKGSNPSRIIAALMARPVSLTADIEADCGISRDTAERLLARMAGLGLVREVTGARRFRLWAAAS